jgi:pimeloyl-ACP methyl ester carboxylesterase
MAMPAFHPFRSERDRGEFHAFYRERSRLWPVPSEDRFVGTASGTTFVRVSGSATSPPLVLLPGARGSSLMWIPSIAALSTRYRTYAIDLVNDVGLSIPGKELAKPEDLVRWLDEVFSVLFPGVGPDLMGISYGGWLAALYASRHPSRVRKVVLLAPGGAVLRVSLAFYLSVALLTLHFPGRREGGGGRLRRLIRWLFEDWLRSAGADREALERDIFDMITAGRFLEKPRMMWPTVFDDAEWRAFEVPALFLVGENEKIYSPKKAIRRLNRVAPRVLTEIIPGAGHDLTWVKADLVAERILAFLGSSAATGASELELETCSDVALPDAGAAEEVQAPAADACRSSSEGDDGIVGARVGAQRDARREGDAPPQTECAGEAHVGAGSVQGEPRGAEQEHAAEPEAAVALLLAHARHVTLHGHAHARDTGELAVLPGEEHVGPPASLADREVQHGAVLEADADLGPA